MATTRKDIDLASAVHGAGRSVPTTPAAQPPSSRRGKRGVLIYVDPEMGRALKQMALDRDTSLQAIGIEAFEALLRGGR